jgi:hypothetical protein
VGMLSVMDLARWLASQPESLPVPSSVSPQP